MFHLLNILAGMGEAMNAFGAARQYRYPQLGDRGQDLKRINGDFVMVGQDLKNKVEKELSNKSHVKVNHRPAKEQRPSHHGVTAGN